MKNEHKKSHNKNNKNNSAPVAKEEKVNNQVEENLEYTTPEVEDTFEELEDELMDDVEEFDNDTTLTTNKVSSSNDSTPKIRVVKPFSKPKMNKKYVPVLLSLVVLLLLGGLAYYYKDYFVAATVNGKSISRLALWMELEKQYGTEMIDSLVTKELVTQEGKKNNIVVSDTDIDSEIANITQDIVAQGSTLDEALMQANLTMDGLKENIRFQKTLEKLSTAEVAVTDAELEEAIAQFSDPEVEVTDEMRNQVRAELVQQKNNQALQMLLTKLRETAQVEVSTKLK